MNEYMEQEYNFETAVKYHKELASSEMLNNSDGFLNLRMILDMKSKKKVIIYFSIIS